MFCDYNEVPTTRIIFLHRKIINTLMQNCIEK